MRQGSFRSRYVQAIAGTMSGITMGIALCFTFKKKSPSRITGEYPVSTTRRQPTNGWQEWMPVIASTYGDDQAGKWWIYWRVFFMACAELWGDRQGNEWIVSHYLFSPRCRSRESTHSGQPQLGFADLFFVRSHRAVRASVIINASSKIIVHWLG